MAMITLRISRAYDCNTRIRHTIDRTVTLHTHTGVVELIAQVCKHSTQMTYLTIQTWIMVTPICCEEGLLESLIAAPNIFELRADA